MVHSNLMASIHVQLRYICQPQTWSHQDSQALCILDSYLPFGVAPPGFQPGLAAWKNSLSSIPPTFPFTVCKPWPSARGMVLAALTAEYQECLKAGPFDVHYQCISAWWHCDCSTRMRCVDTFCWHLSLISLYREDAWNVPVSSFFLNDSAHNILNDVLKIMFIWSCWKLALQWFYCLWWFPGVCHPLEYNLSDKWHGNELLLSCFWHKFD